MENYSAYISSYWVFFCIHVIIFFVVFCILEMLCRSVDYNPNKPLMLITGGNDRKVKFWDTRNMGKPLKVLAGHSHWVWGAKFNPYHDQLIVR